jgi:hypothetical protein
MRGLRENGDHVSRSAWQRPGADGDADVLKVLVGRCADRCGHRSVHSDESCDAVPVGTNTNPLLGRAGTCRNEMVMSCSGTS